LHKDLGDFQTPPLLVSAILASLRIHNKSWTRVLEPTCGRGNFIEGLLQNDVVPSEIQGIEIQQKYVEEACVVSKQATRITITHGDIFATHLYNDIQWQDNGPLLVLGNPPWITNAALGVLESKNIPQKTNIKELSGFDARTGKANFDIAEYIWLKIIRELAPERPTIALLCKTSVARNVLQQAYNTNLTLHNMSIRKIDTKKWFNADVDACLFYVEVGREEPSYQISVYQDLFTTQLHSTMGVIDGHVVGDVLAYKYSFPVSKVNNVTWRQGVKHDAASVMELEVKEGQLRNKLGEIVSVEAEHVYPLLKSSDLFHYGKTRPQKAVIVTQKKLGADTSVLEQYAPELWKYLIQHRQFFERRKSSIYEKQPLFAMFGIGDYSFAFYKVAISGFHKIPKFRVLEPVNGRPIMLDDTCYFIPCSSLQEASLIAEVLNSQTCLDYIHSILFLDAKRPITKKLLQRIHVPSLTEQAKYVVEV